MKNKSGFVAIMDALVAYSVAFIMVGAIVLTLTGANNDMGKKTLILNQYAEDIAEDIAQSRLGHFCFNSSDCKRYILAPYAPYRTTTSPSIELALKNELSALAKREYLNINVSILDRDTKELKTEWLFTAKSGLEYEYNFPASPPPKPQELKILFSSFKDSAVAHRVLFDDSANGAYTGYFHLLVVTVGISDKK